MRTRGRFGLCFSILLSLVLVTRAVAQQQLGAVYSLGPDFALNTALGRGLDGRGGIIGARVALRVVHPSLEIPEYCNWFTGAQYQLPWNFMAELNYNGTAGRKLMSGDGPTSEDYNRFSGDLLDNVRNRLNPSFASVDFNESRAYSNYHGMSAQLQRRQIRLEAFNAFNWTNLNNPVSNTNSANFGRVTGARPMRVVQLGAKWLF